MSYIKQPLGGVLDVMASLTGGTPPTSDEQACLNKANASPQVAAIDAEIDKLSKGWHPTGYYSPADVQNILAVFADEAEAAGAALASAPISTGDASQVKAQAFADLMRKYSEPSKGYENAVIAAKSAGSNAIDAPGFKDWVIRSMRAISDAYVTATVLQCRQSWVEKWLDRAFRAMMAIGAVVWRVGGVAANLAVNVVKAVESAAGIVGALIRIAPFAAVGVGAYFLYTEFKKR
jgi:hypothetical protein